ncbi:glycoside hydrolase family 13 protein [Agromyces sp. NPDC058126]|uniref:glycoside hydrolase family 13 protein n=1 Tax=Agromyces sp. NPDC058126 TaxID=3346350 RepID=UPI0036DC5C52
MTSRTRTAPAPAHESGDLPVSRPDASTVVANPDWWRTAAIYQIYPRSFADANGDGMGDLAGVTARLGALQDLGIDAIWLSPFYTSPQKDGGYDVADYCDVDPLFGTLTDFDAMVAEAHARGIRVIVDIVPNHSSDAHPWFQAALTSAPGSAERGRYLFREGRGTAGELPPNNWASFFGGPAWTRVVEPDGTPGQWYLHLFDSSQPDFDWTNEEVHDEFRRILRFWLDRGVDGFRVDVASSLVKAEGLPDYHPGDDDEMPPYEGRAAVHDIFRDWRRLLDEYPGERILAAEAWIKPLARRADWVRHDEMHQAFNDVLNFWDASALRASIDGALTAFGSVGAPTAWVASNHDGIRTVTTLMFTPAERAGGVGPRTTGIPSYDQSIPRARAMAMLMLALPGSAYLYQGEELGLPEATDIPDAARQDPTFFRTEGEQYGRDGCRVPIPWESASPSYGFGTTDASWLPQPEIWGRLARDRQQADPDSTLNLYRAAIALRRERGLDAGELEWLPGYAADVLAFRNADVTVLINTGAEPVPLPAGEVLLTSTPHDLTALTTLAPDTAVWIHA